MPSRTLSGPHRQSPTRGSGRRIEWPTRLPGTEGPVDCLRVTGLTLQHHPALLGAIWEPPCSRSPPPLHPRPTGTTSLTCANTIQAGKIINRSSFGTKSRRFRSHHPDSETPGEAPTGSVGASPVSACVSIHMPSAPGPPRGSVVAVGQVGIALISFGRMLRRNGRLPSSLALGQRISGSLVVQERKSPELSDSAPS